MQVLKAIPTVELFFSAEDARCNFYRAVHPGASPRELMLPRFHDPENSGSKCLVTFLFETGRKQGRYYFQLLLQIRSELLETQGVLFKHRHAPRRFSLFSNGKQTDIPFLTDFPTRTTYSYIPTEKLCVKPAKENGGKWLFAEPAVPDEIFMPRARTISQQQESFELYSGAVVFVPTYHCQAIATTSSLISKRPSIEIISGSRYLGEQRR